MTPILRKSKESARLQRAKPEEERRRAIPTNRPLSSNRGGPPGGGFGPRGHGRDLKRRAEHYERSPESKYMRTSSSSYRRPLPPPAPHISYDRTRYSSSGGSSRSDRYNSYERSGSSYSSSAYRSSYGEGGGSSRSYYESIGAYSSNSGSGRPRQSNDRSYDRSVDDFLRKTGGESERSRDRSRYRDYR